MVATMNGHPRQHSGNTRHDTGCPRCRVGETRDRGLVGEGIGDGTYPPRAQEYLLSRIHSRVNNNDAMNMKSVQSAPLSMLAFNGLSHIISRDLSNPEEASTTCELLLATSTSDQLLLGSTGWHLSSSLLASSGASWEILEPGLWAI